MTVDVVTQEYLPTMARVNDAPASSWTCPSCGSSATSRYCGHCGERRIDVLPGAASEGVAGPDRSFLDRVRASLRALVSPPGQLTTDWIRGRRVGYLAPLSLFLWINVVFFLVQSVTGLGILTWPLKVHLSDDSMAWVTTRLLARRHPDMTVPTGAYADMFNALEAVHAKSLVIVMVPVFAAVLGALMLDRRERLQDALTFALHFFAFALLWLCALFPLVAIVLRLSAAAGVAVPVHHSMDLVVTSLEAAVLGWYLYVALATVFGISRRRRAFTVLALIAALYFILKAYHVVVFSATLYAI